MSAPDQQSTAVIRRQSQLADVLSKVDDQWCN